MKAKFDGKEIFGIAIRQEQSATRRVLREELPGVQGFRNYNLSGVNPDTRKWTIRGRLVESSLLKIETELDRGESYMNGKFYNFTTNAGRVIPNCQIVDYRQTGKIQRLPGGFAVEITATIEQGSR